jgi:hypothetical protein
LFDLAMPSFLSRADLVALGVDVYVLDKLTEKFEAADKEYNLQLAKRDGDKYDDYNKLIDDVMVCIIYKNDRDMAEMIQREHIKALNKRFGAGNKEGDGDDYGDGDQSQIKDVGRAFQINGMFNHGGDHNPFKNPLMSAWSRCCFLSDLGVIKFALKKDSALLDKRESCLRLNGFLHAIFGAVCKSPSYEHWTDNTIAPLGEDHVVESLVFLLRSGTDVNSRDSSGSTALFYLTGHGASEFTLRLAQILIKDFGADVNAVNRTGQTPLFNVLRFTTPFKSDSVKMLFGNGAKTNITDHCGNSLISWVQNVSVKAMSPNGVPDGGCDGMCDVCNAIPFSTTLQRCGRCLNRFYCGRECQIKDWKSGGGHSKVCKKNEKPTAGRMFRRPEDEGEAKVVFKKRELFINPVRVVFVDPTVRT